MSKQATIASLVRTAAKTEAEFMSTVEGIFEEDDVERIWEFFDRLNIPRSQGAEDDLMCAVPEVGGPALAKRYDYGDESRVSSGIQRFLDRHERKIKWHATHPSLDGVDNVLLLFRSAMAITNLRLARLKLLLQSKDELSPEEWSSARKLMNNSFLSFRNFLNLVAGEWVDAMSSTVPRDELAAKLGRFYELVDQQIQRLEKQKEELEGRRREMAVLPDGYPPVKPPVYFHGDLLGKGPWKLFWQSLNDRAHHFREAVG
ncbi:MAG: hypothetical protein H6738_25475 [Alphaproteobacteria bacterium]|nr:hypothetical protein [Alphaproteobacteria bacterium]MCB9700165.1 hypothetical protein [Alphaproteobacteria bacterium]